MAQHVTRDDLYARKFGVRRAAVSDELQARFAKNASSHLTCRGKRIPTYDLKVSEL